MTGKLYVSLAPWVMFAVVARTGGEGVAWAGLAAAATAVVVLTLGMRSGFAKALDLGAVLLFAALTGWGAADPARGDFIQRYGRALSAFGLAAIMLGSLVVAPIVRQFTRETVRTSAWHTADFRRGNQMLTALWGGVALAVGLAHVVAAALNTRVVATVFNWVVPITIAIVGARNSEAIANRYFDDESTGFEAITLLEHIGETGL